MSFRLRAYISFASHRIRFEKGSQPLPFSGGFMNTVKKDCYRLVQIVVLKKYPICGIPNCGRPSEVGHHLFPRNRMGTAFNPRAVFPCCNDHHGLFHQEPDEYKEIARKCLGDEYEQLRTLSLMTVKFSEDDFRRIRSILTALAEEI